MSPGGGALVFALALALLLACEGTDLHPCASLDVKDRITTGTYLAVDNELFNGHPYYTQGTDSLYLFFASGDKPGWRFSYTLSDVVSEDILAWVDIAADYPEHIPPNSNWTDPFTNTSYDTISIVCTPKDCDGVYNFGSCSVTCGSGKKYGVYAVTTPAMYGGTCPQVTVNVTRSCGTPCPVNCTGHYNYGTCGVSCGGGFQTGQFTVTTSEKYNGTCDLKGTSVTQQCNTQPCPVNCAGHYDYEPCGVSCGGSSQTGHYNVTSPEQFGGTCDLKGTSVTQQCNTQPCTPPTPPTPPTPSPPPPPACGNFVLEDGEQCDDGNHLDHDGCDSSCHWEDQLGHCNCSSAFIVDYTLDVLVRELPPEPVYNLTSDGSTFFVQVSYPYTRGGVYITGSDETWLSQSGFLPQALPSSSVRNSSEDDLAHRTPFNSSVDQTVCTNVNPFTVVGSPPWTQEVQKKACGYTITLPVDPLSNLKPVLPHRKGGQPWLTRTLDTNSNTVTVTGTIYTCFLQAVLPQQPGQSLSQVLYASYCNRMVLTVAAQLDMTASLAVWGSLPQGPVRAWADLTFDPEGHLIVSLTFVHGSPAYPNYVLDLDALHPVQVLSTDLNFTLQLETSPADLKPALTLTSTGDPLPRYTFSTLLNMSVKLENQPAYKPFSAAVRITGDVVNPAFQKTTSFQMSALEWGSPTGELRDAKPNIPALGSADWMIVGIPLPAALLAHSGSANLTVQRTNRVIPLIVADDITQAPAAFHLRFLSKTEQDTLGVKYGFMFQPAALLLSGPMTVTVRVVPALDLTTQHTPRRAQATTARHALPAQRQQQAVTSQPGSMVQLPDGSYLATVQFSVTLNGSVFAGAVQTALPPGAISSLPSSASLGIAVGASVGGVAAVVLAALGVWALIRRRTSRVCAVASRVDVEAFPGVPVVKAKPEEKLAAQAEV